MSQMASMATYAVAILVRDLLTTAMGASTGQRNSTAPRIGTIRCGNGIRSVARCTRSTRLSFSRPVDWTLAVGNIVLPRTVVSPCIAHQACSRQHTSRHGARNSETSEWATAIEEGAGRESGAYVPKNGF